MQVEIQSYDERRDIAVAGNHEEMIAYSIEHFISLANQAIKNQGYFAVALSGGSTPKAIFQGLSNDQNKRKIDWKKVMLFWGDERCVPPTHPDSNYKMAMDAGFGNLNIPSENIFRMHGEDDPEKADKQYDLLLSEEVPMECFDLVMLGMGDDGHTASLFPKTHALHTVGRMVTANYVPQKDTWRLTLTYECINAAKNIAIYVMGKGKAEMIAKVLKAPFDPDTYPIQKIGTASNKALWILDREAANLIL